MSSYTCSKCGYTTKTKGNMNPHIERIKCKGAEMIQNVVKLKCEICNKTCDTEKLLESHKKSCIKKRLEIINNDVDGELKKQIDLLTIMFRVQQNEIEDLKSMIKRVEKLEKQIASKEEEEEEEEEEIPEGEKCYHSKEVPFIPLSKKHIHQKQKDVGAEVEDNLLVTVKNQRSDRVDANCEEDDYIEVNNIKFYYNKSNKTKGVRSADELKVIVKEFCENIVTKTNKKGEFCCEEHY